MIILQNPSGESNARDPRKIIITEKDREREREKESEKGRGNGRSIRRVQINIARGFARKSRTLQISAAPLSRADMPMTSDPIRMQIRVVCAVIEP